MSDVDVYLAQVRRSMFGMAPAVREDILRELQSHLSEAVAGNGGDAAKPLREAGPPNLIGREYRQIYGFGTVFKLAFATIAFILAIPSSPILQITQEFPIPNILAIPFLIVLVAWVLWVSVEAGSRAGILAGIAAFLARAVVEVWLAAMPPYPAPTAAGIGLFVATGVVLVLLGWLPGTAKKAWSRPSGDL